MLLLEDAADMHSNASALEVGGGSTPEVLQPLWASLAHVSDRGAHAHSLFGKYSGFHAISVLAEESRRFHRMESKALTSQAKEHAVTCKRAYCSGPHARLYGLDKKDLTAGVEALLRLYARL